MAVRLKNVTSPESRLYDTWQNVRSVEERRADNDRAAAAKGEQRKNDG